MASELILEWGRTSLQHARPSGVLHGRSDGLERPPRPVAQFRNFQEEAEDASVSECTWTRSALEALRNALYKFKTYLLTRRGEAQRAESGDGVLGDGVAAPPTS